ILRIAYPYRSQFPKKDFLRAMLARLQEGKPIAAITDHVFTPTYIDDVAYAIKTLIEKNETGIFHVVGSESLSPYDAALKIVQEFALDKNLISATTRSEYFQGKAPRPFHLSMRNDKIEKLGITMHGFSEGLAFIKKSL
ncbi:MAG: sugar nucleotide-binding protein, partial [Candidatus Levyibacteriota bacterium]